MRSSGFSSNRHHFICNTINTPTIYHLNVNANPYTWSYCLFFFFWQCTCFCFSLEYIVLSNYERLIIIIQSILKYIVGAQKFVLCYKVSPTSKLEVFSTSILSIRVEICLCAHEWSQKLLSMSSQQKARSTRSICMWQFITNSISWRKKIYINIPF